MKSILTIPALAAVFFAAPVSRGTVISDFSGGVVAVNHPEGSGDEAPTYYDISDAAFATPSAGTLAGSPALKIDDGGFTNGVYSIYSAVVPATGTYTVSVDMLVQDTETSQMTAYQIGVIVNGVHRGPNPSKIANATIFGNYTGLNSGELDDTTIQKVETQQFTANAGDSLLIAFSTDVTSGYDSNAGFFNGASILADNLELNAVPEPGGMAVAGMALVATLAARRRAGSAGQQ